MKIFLATALEKQREDELALVLELRTSLNAVYGRDAVFLAAYEYPTPDTYLPPRKALDVVLDTLEACDVFVLYYPRKVFSGALMEIAWAMLWHKPCLVITDTVENLPYMIREGAPGIRVACIANGQDISPAEAPKYVAAIRELADEVLASLRT